MRVGAIAAMLTCGALMAAATAAVGQSNGQADSILGTWRLNLSESRVLRGVPDAPFPAAWVETYRRLESGQIELTISRTSADGTSTRSQLMWPAEGGVVTRIQGPAPDGQMLIETRLGPNEWRVTYLQNGKQTRTRQKLVAPDGKTMRQTLQGFGSDGHPFETLQVFDRQ